MKLAGKIAWVTGAGSGIGRASALALAAGGATLILTGRRREPLEETARRIDANAVVQPGDVTSAARIQEIGTEIGNKFGHLDIVVNNAGINIPRRAWSELTPEGIDALLRTNLNSAFYVVTAALPLMRPGKSGLFIHIGSRVGRFWDGPSGVGYTAAKTALVAMSHGINREEWSNGIRSSIINLGETATEILKTRKASWSEEELARLLRPEDVADLVRYIACLPPHVCMSEVMFTPTWNRTYVAAQQQMSQERG
jgi:NAD(P)-dependent dehydrogenase (short-subunit alcohol dehydrogenase family)